MRAVDAEDVHPADHLVQALPVRPLGLGLGAQALAVVIVDLQAEGAGAARHRLSDPAHAQNAKTPPGKAPAQMGHG